MKPILIAGSLIICVHVLVLPASSGIIEFADSALHEAVLDELGIHSNLPLFREDILKLTQLTARGAHISSLEGIEAAVNLQQLDLRDNDLHDLKPLSGLQQLVWLSVRENSAITDLSPLSDLTRLRYLNINRNENIESIVPLQGLRALEVLIMRAVPVLHRADEQQVLTYFTRLERLNVRNTGLTSVAVLLNHLERDGFREQLDVRENPLTDAELLEPYSDDIENFSAGL